MQLTTDQTKAIELCTDLSRRIVSVTGQAGTGKTSIIKQTFERLVVRGRDVALAAPTGRSARRIYESTGIRASTIHRLLGYGRPEIDPDTGAITKESAPSRHRDNPLEFTDIIVDEYAMVSEELHRNLIDALPPGGRLLVFGDVNQLPPIEHWEIKTHANSPFERLLSLPNSVVLDVVFRQTEASGILDNARRVRSGHSPIKHSDFNVVVSPSPIKVLREHLGTDAYDYRLLSNQIITPSRQGALGAHALNQIVQRHYRYEKGLFMPRHKWDMERKLYCHVGEKVICVENTYDMRDYFERFGRWQDENTPDVQSYINPPDTCAMLNGEIGTVVSIGQDGGLEIEFPDRTVQVPSKYRDVIPRVGMIDRDPRKAIELAYAVTTHKMQGSECDHVTFITNRIQFTNINRNNIYTAITRAKRSVLYITDQTTWRNGQRMTAREKQKAIEDHKNDRRRSKT